MAEKNIQTQIDEINSKLDFILEEIYEQKQARENINDLVQDVSIIGTDVFKTTVVQLDKAGVEIDGEVISNMGLKLLRNLENFNELLETLESAQDLVRDLSPIIHQVGLDAIHKMNELEQKGYIDFIKELTSIVDNIVTHFSTEDVRALADNIVTILETVKNLTQPDMLQAVNNAVMIFKNLDPTDVPEYSMWKLMKEFRSKEMRRGLGIMITFLKRMAAEESTENKQS